ncbi:MAG: hypothetical protein AAFQ45_03490 [Pseudomonadota bacterium]
MTVKQAARSGRSGAHQSSPQRRDRRLIGFQPQFRTFISQLTSSSPKLEDLADTFPALLFALATGYGTARQRGAAFTLIAEGRPLKDAAAALRVPMWMRKLPASAFTDRFETIPLDAAFETEISHLVPTSPATAAPWLARVLYAAEAADPQFALWAAKHHRAAGPDAGQESFRYLAAWAWFASRPGTTGHAILRRGWSETISPRRAAEEAAVWRRRLTLAYALAARPECADWGVAGEVNGHSFVPLTSVADFVAEGDAMANCLDQYAGALDSGAVSVFSIRRQGRRVANLEIRLDVNEGCAPVISQLKRARNRHASKLLWQTAYAWLGAQPMRAIPRPKPATRTAVRKAVMAIWEPYLSWLPPRHAQAFELHLRATEMAQTNRATRVSLSHPQAPRTT